MSRHVYEIGDWIFLARQNELRQGSERRRLEDRAARMLEFLCASKGETVSHDILIENIWHGRSQSPNSVPVVIGQLRRALGDEARNPRFIETISKRGYRLVAEVREQGGSLTRLRYPRWQVMAAVAVIAAGILFAGIVLNRSLRPVMTFSGVVNSTGNAEYDPLARATAELIAVQLNRQGVRLKRGVAGPADTQFQVKLILWNNEPTISLAVMDEEGNIQWSAMARGPARNIPISVSRSLDDFVATSQTR